jgi:hypothetical protein
MLEKSFMKDQKIQKLEIQLRKYEQKQADWTALRLQIKSLLEKALRKRNSQL